MIPSLLEELSANSTHPYRAFLMTYELTVEVIVATCDAKGLGGLQAKW